MTRFGLALTFLLLVPAALRATIFVPMTIDDLARSSVAVVIGTVDRLTSVDSPDGRISTLVAVRIEEVLRGDVPVPVVTLKEDGGTVGRHREVVFGTPSYTLGERVLLFLSVRADGSLRTNQLAQGKFHLDVDAAGMPRAARRFGTGTTVIVPPGTAGPATVVPLGEIFESVRRSPPLSLPAFQTQPLEANDPSLPHEITAEFMLLGPGRFFEADEGMPLSFEIDESGDAILGLTTARQAVDDAFAAWTSVPTATVSLQDTGLTADVTTPCPGPNKIRFNNPDGSIPPPMNCSGTLGIGGFCSDMTESKTFAGTTFQRALRSRLTLASGWQGCDVWTACNVAEIATHEIGHSIGMGHSSENVLESDPTLRDATMYFRAHFDGRCASIRSDDIEGISFIYPTAIPPTITTPKALPAGVVFTPYHVALAATGGSGPYTWTVASTVFPGLSVSADGVLFGMPTATSTGFDLLIKAVDANGDSHTKRFKLRVNATSQECVGDCNAAGSVAVSDIVTGVNIALGHVTAALCPTLSMQPNGAVRVDALLKAINNALDGCGG